MAMNRALHNPDLPTPATPSRIEWILVANAARARLLEQRPGQPLRLLRHFEHPESRLHAQDLADDQTGRRASDRGYGAMALAARSDPHRKQAERFALELADHLEQAAQHGELDQLLVFAAPPFLSLMRRHCGPTTRRHVAGMFNVDLSGVGTAELAPRIAHERAERVAEPPLPPAAQATGAPGTQAFAAGGTQPSGTGD